MQQGLGIITNDLRFFQFAYGDTQQYSYSIGDAISWGGNDIGEKGRSEVSVLGTPEYCRVCGLAVEGEYVLIIRNNRIGRLSEGVGGRYC